MTTYARSRSARGFSLLEVVVAFAILVVALLSVMSLTLTSANLSRTSTERSQARALGIAKLAELRADLHSAALDPTTTGPQQFLNVVASIGIIDSGTGLTPPQVTPVTVIEGAPPGAIEVVAYCREDTAQTDLSVTNLDLDGDGTTGSATIIEPQFLRILPIRIRVTWQQATWKPGDPVSQVELAGILY